MTPPASSRGGSTPPRPPAGCQAAAVVCAAGLAVRHHRRDRAAARRAAPRPGAAAVSRADRCRDPWPSAATRSSARPGGPAERRTGHDHGLRLAQRRARRGGPAHRDAGRLPARPSPWSASSPTKPIPAGGPRRRSPRRRSPSATATPATPAARSCPAATTHASFGRCPSPEIRRVAAGRVAFRSVLCGPDRHRVGRPTVRPADVWIQGGTTNDGQDLAAADTTA